MFYSNAPAGFDALLITDLFKKSATSLLYILPDGKTLQQTYDNIKYFAPKIEVLTLPAWDIQAYDRVSPNAEIVAERIKTLSNLVLYPTERRVILASTSSVLQYLPPKEIFANSFIIKKGKSINRKDFLSFLSANGYNKTEQVLEPLEFAVRGDIIDIFAPSAENPIRIDFFDDEVENIKLFDPLSQRTIKPIDEFSFYIGSEVLLTPETIATFRQRYIEEFGSSGLQDEIYEAISQGSHFNGAENWLPLFYKNLNTIFDYIHKPKIIVAENVFEAIKNKLESITDYYQARIDNPDDYKPVAPNLFYYNQEGINIELRESSEISSQSIGGIDKKVLPARTFYPNNFDELKEYIADNADKKIVVGAYAQSSIEKIKNIVGETKAKIEIAPLISGFKSDKLLFITEADIFGEKPNKVKKNKASSKNFIADVSQLNADELVVHIEHGIGRFLGLETIVAGGQPHDCLKVLYNNGAKLYVPVENIDVLSRYGIEDDNIVLDTIGGVAWGSKKEKIKKRIKEIAAELIAIAAQRELKKADVFHLQEALYQEFCSRFLYNETDDQLSAIEDIFTDLAKGMPMDRLVCGDVGFGKTEVALRAAFNVASNGSQVALIVPTTLLARQHYLNFKKRFDGLGIRVEMLSRLVTPTNAKKIKEDIKDGKVNIVIGTHALLAKDIEFANIGMLIIDEEQHFGVVHKEKLKHLKANIHVLTLSATPIPRTLQLSLTGVKNLSIIATPPVDRLAVRSFVMPFDRVMIKEAIYREKFRGGQTYFVCPRVSDIFELHKELTELLPDIKVLVANGQMSPAKLEDVMTSFADGEADVLLATTIIESGIDLPSVNTMIIHRSDMFGLAQLYQLKGRIGRSKTRGYCYFTVPKQKKLKPIAQKRLNILQSLDSLGAGFMLASHDMDLRGSGNILGDEQSGHIKEVGISLYQQMLEEEINRQKQGLAEDVSVEWSPQITIGIPIIIPENYVADLSMRLGLYKRIADLKDDADIAEMTSELIDRFGTIPQPVTNLLKIVEIKQLCRALNIEKIDAGDKGFLITFKNNKVNDVDKLISISTNSFGKIKLRPDSKVQVIEDLSDYSKRIEKIKATLERL
ncbi:MAG: transcription-repair coupling factor [Alphaproteobacteria bacterium]